MLINTWTYLDVILNGKRLDLSNQESILSFSVIADEKSYLPCLELSILSSMDNIEFLESNGCSNDYASIQVSFGMNVDTATSIPFRLISWKKKEVESGVVLTIVGLYDNLPYITNRTPEIAIDANSSAFIKKICTKYGLSTKNFSYITSDFGIWNTSGKTAAEAVSWATDISYLKDQSVMHSAVDLDGSLVYRDVLDNSFSFRKKFKTVIDNKDNNYFLVDTIEKSIASESTILNGYSSKLIYQDISKDSTKILERLPITLPSSYSINLNKSALSEINAASMDTVIDFGNGHTNYSKALYNNRRYNSLFSCLYRASTIGKIDINILDSVLVFNATNQMSVPAYVSKIMLSVSPDYKFCTDIFMKSMYTLNTANSITNLL